MKINLSVVDSKTPFEQIPVGGVFSTELGNVYLKGQATTEKLGQLGTSEYKFRTRDNSYFAGQSFKTYKAEVVLS